MRRSFLLTLVILLVVSGALSAPAAADARADVASSTTLSFSGPATFSGKVTSAKKQCKKTRAISLVDASGAIVGKATSSKSGAWKIQFNPIATGGTYVAKVAKLKVRIATGKLVCAATTSAPVIVPPDPRFALTVAKSGNGSGAITSLPGGINCGTDCSETYDGGALVTLVASPSAGSEIASWSGDCVSEQTSCTVTMSGVRNVTATFTLDSHQLAVDLAGNGSGSVTSAPTGIDCGTDCAGVFDHGTSVTLTPTPATGSTFSGWSGACSGTGDCAVSMTQARSVTATFAPISRLLIVVKTGTGTVTSAQAGIVCGADCTESYAHGTSVTLFAEPGVGQAFSGWTGDCTGADELCTVTMSAARTVNAAFAPVPQQLVVDKAGSGSGSVTSSPAGISCGGDCVESYALGTPVTLTAAATTGSTFTGWAGACTGSGACQVTMSQARSVTALFTKNGYTLDVARSGNGHGTVSSTPGAITCGSHCSATFEHGTSVTLTPTADADSTFTGWSGACAGTGACVVTVDQATSVTATFTLKKFNLFVEASGAGTIASTPAGILCTSVCGMSFDAGTVVSLTAEATTQSVFTGWSGDCQGTAPCQVTMSQLRQVTANFVPRIHQLTATVAGAGSGVVSSSPVGINCGIDCSHDYQAHTVVSLTPSPGPGSYFVGWGGACSGTAPCTVEMLQATSVTAFFEPNTLTIVRTGTGPGTVSGFGISCGDDCTHQFNSNQIVTLTATPSTDAIFTGWDDNTGCGPAPTCQIIMNGPRTISARFVPAATLAVGLTGSGSGSVASNPTGIDCGADCTEKFATDAIVTLTAAPGPNSVFVGWDGAGCSGTGSCSVSMSQARSVTAEFSQAFVLEVFKDGDGLVQSSPNGIDCGPTCSAPFVAETVVTLTATPGPGYTFLGWVGACSGSGQCELQMSQSYQVAALFE